jgi:segregation and condensation protein B
MGPHGEEAAAKPAGEQTRLGLEQILVPLEKEKEEAAPAIQASDDLASEAGIAEEVPAAPMQGPKADSPMAADGPQAGALSASQMPSSSLEPLRVLEAALFMSSMAMPTADLGKLVGIGAVGHVSGLLAQLSRQYEQSGSSLEVVEENAGKWVMRIRAPFAPSVRRFAGEAEIPKHALRTLAYISRHENITKRELFKRLGGTIYEDVGELVDKGFLQTKPSGRTQALSTTNKFKQYFQG